MSLELYAHPFSSYCQKVLIPLYENDIPFELRLLEPGNAASAEHAARWPLRRMPVLVDGDRTVVEASIIVEHLDLRHRGRVRLVPDDPEAALDVRMMDRVFDNYVMTPMQKIVFDAIRPPEQKDPQGVADARTTLDTAYRWLDGVLAGHEWAARDVFSLADCAAAPDTSPTNITYRATAGYTTPSDATAQQPASTACMRRNPPPDTTPWTTAAP